MIKYFCIAVISFFLFINLNAYAQEEQKENKEEAVFKYKTNDKPPTGFEDLINNVSYGYIDIYFINKYIGSFQAEYTNETITFYDAEEIFNLLSQNVTFIDKTKILNILNNPLSSNSKYVCDERRDCGTYIPNIIGLIFDKRTLSSNFYINYDNVLEEKIDYEKILPNSTASNSFIQSMDLNFFSESDSDLDFSLSGNSIYGYKEHRIRTNWILNQDDFFINQIYYGNDIDGKTTKIGYINSNTFGYTFTPNIRMLGLEYSTSINTRKDLQTEFSEPLPIFFNSRAAVKIVVNGELIYSEYLEAGNQIINTQNFPSGSYNLQIEIIEDNGNTRTLERFYVKSISIPPEDEDLFYINLGFIEDNEFLDNNLDSENQEIPLFPEVENELFLKLGMASRINSQSAMYNEIIYEKNNYLYNPTFYYLGNGYEIKSSLLYGNKNAKGLTFDFNMPFYNNNVSIFTRYISENQNNFVADEGLSISASYNLNMEKYGSLSLFGTYDKSNFNDLKNKSYTLSYRNNFYNSKEGSLNFNFDVSKNNNETFFNIGFTYNFNKNDKWNYRTTPTWRRRGNMNDYNISNNIRYNNQDKKTEISSTLTTNNSKDSKNILLNNIVTDQRYGTMNLDVNHDYSNSENERTSILGNISTNFATDGSSFTFGGKRRLESGIIIDLSKYNLKDNFQLFVNGIATDEIRSSEKTFIPLSPYSEYSIYLKSLSKDNFIRVRSKRESVTTYPGNIETLEWEIERMQILSGQLFDQYGNIIKSKTVYSNSNKTFSDEFGFFQLDIVDIDDSIWVEFKNNRCIFDVNTVYREDVMYFDQVVCIYKDSESLPENNLIINEEIKVTEDKVFKVIDID